MYPGRTADFAYADSYYEHGKVVVVILVVRFNSLECRGSDETGKTQ